MLLGLSHTVSYIISTIVYNHVSLQNKESPKAVAMITSKEVCIRFIVTVLCGHFDNEETTGYVQG